VVAPHVRAAGAAGPARVRAAAGRGVRAPVPWQASFAALALIWGCSFWFIKVGLEALSAVQVAFWRLALGAAALLAISLAVRVRPPRRPATWAHLAVVAALLNSVPFTLFAYGELHVSSVIAAMINAATPLATLLVVLAAFREERPGPRGLAGLLIGFAGVLVVLGIWRGLGDVEWRGVLACLAAIACYGVALPYARRHLRGAPEGPLALATGQVLLGAGLLVPLLPWTGLRESSPEPSVVLAMLALGVLGSGVAYVLNFHVIGAAGSGTAASVTYVIPLVAVVAGVAFLGESVHAHEVAGGAVIVLGALVAAGRLPGGPAARTG